MSQPQHSPQLAELLLVTAQTVRQVLAGKSLTHCLESLDPAQRAAVQALSFYCMRHLARGRALARLLLRKKAPNPLFHALLISSLCLLSSDPEDPYAPRYAPHTLVDQAVKATQQHAKTRSFKALLNACLREYLRQPLSLLAALQNDPEVQYGFPQWWIDQVSQAYPLEWPAILASANRPGPLSLRVNQRKITRDQYSALLAQTDMAHQVYEEDAVILQQAVPVQQLPGFAEGLVSVQDLGAQLAAPLLPLEPGLRVLDACAAPGGKTAHILERADVEMTVLDIDAQRLARVEQNLNHLGLMGAHVHMRAADAAELEQWWDGQLFDRIMADVPCTASGIVRRHPDIKWLRQPSDIAQTAALQRKIVKALWSTLAPGGYFLYITCSIFPQEGEQQAQYIINELPGAERLPAPGQLLPLATEPGGMAAHDGFFYALFCKGLKW